jgi:hypothetical protein
MSLHTPNEFMMKPCKCHVCFKEVTEKENAIEHSGHGQSVRSEDPGIKEGYVTIWMHPECATILMLRLANDVMRMDTRAYPPRVVDSLKNLVNQRKDHGDTQLQVRVQQLSRTTRAN